MKRLTLVIMMLVMMSLAYAMYPDADEDGIRDEEDRCSNTFYDIVDRYGCSCIQKSANICEGRWCCKNGERCIDAECVNVTKINPEIFSFVVYGDTEKDTVADRIHRRIVNRIVDLSPNMVFHVGDMVRFQSFGYMWDNFFNIIKPITDKGIPFYAARGNAELGSAWDDKMDFLPGNKHYYTIEYDNALFIVFDGNEDISPGSPQYIFIENALKNNNKEWVFVMNHFPFYNAGYHASG